MTNYDIPNSIARYFGSVDQEDWATTRTLMTNPFHLDYSSFGAADAADLDPEDILKAWSEFLPGFEHTHHQIGNLDIQADGDSAKVSCYGTATHSIGERVWTVVGTYNIRLVCEAGNWKLTGVQFLFKYQTGSIELPDLARKRMEAS